MCGSHFLQATEVLLYTPNVRAFGDLRVFVLVVLCSLYVVLCAVQQTNCFPSIRQKTLCTLYSALERLLVLVVSSSRLAFRTRGLRPYAATEVQSIKYRVYNVKCVRRYATTEDQQCCE